MRNLFFFLFFGAPALGLTLAFEPIEPDVMHRPPRPPGAPILDRVAPNGVMVPRS